MTDAILLAYKDVENSMERFTMLLQSHVETMGADPLARRRQSLPLVARLQGDEG